MQLHGPVNQSKPRILSYSNDSGGDILSLHLHRTSCYCQTRDEKKIEVFLLLGLCADACGKKGWDTYTLKHICRKIMTEFVMSGC